MNTKQRKRQRDIKTKLMAAICMLLVSSIMMVSTTYAWFTLSTAPEVTGINTSVGANGALEMALLPESGDVNAITSNVGDSIVGNAGGVKAANVTWGNLVDLGATVSDNNTKNVYGLDQIQLMPSRLNLSTKTGEGVLAVSIPLSTPEYGYDGRVTTMANKTMTSVVNDQQQFTASAGDKYGVRAIGTASALSPRENNFRTYRSTGASARLNAQDIAATSLQTNGQILANMAIDHASGNDTFGADEKAALQAVVDAMAGSDDSKVDGALEYIEESLRSYLLAAISSGKFQYDEKDNPDGLTKEVYETFMTTNSSKTLAELLALNEVKTALGESNYFVTASNNLAAVKTKMTQAQTAIDALSDEADAEYTWEQMRPILAYMVDPDAMVVNGYTVAEIQANNSLLVNSYTSTGKLELYLYQGAGVFADIAEFCGDYDTPITLNVKYGSLTVPDLKAYMYAECASKSGTTVTPLNPVLTGIATYINETLGAPAGEIGGDSFLTDFYGYIVDLAFRTNAADATLQLQTEAKDRIYSDNEDANADTWGGGSFMTFKGASGFSNEQVLNLMDSINVVFFDKDSGAIYGIAKLDTTNYTAGANGVTARLFMMNYTINADTGALTFTSVKGEEIVYATGTPLFNATESNPASTTGSKITVYGPEGVVVNGNYHVPTDAAYTFTLSGTADRTNYDVEYVVGDAATGTKIEAADGTYTIPAIATASTVTIKITPVYTQDAELTTVTETEGTTYVDVAATIPVGVTMTGNAKTVKATTSETGAVTGTDYTFTLGNTVATSTYTVAYKVGNGDIEVLSATNGTYTIEGEKITDNITITVTERRAFEAEGDIVQLVQNTAKTVSALVYLDGDSVTNADVANAASSMTGTLNLQFSTNVPLVPMEYTPLMEQDAADAGNQG